MLDTWLHKKTAITGLSADEFEKKVRLLSDEQEYGHECKIEFNADTGAYGIELPYRDSANYRIDTALFLDIEGTVWVAEPEWNEDEDEEQVYFWQSIYAAFDTEMPVSPSEG